jgi:hypothetical protein
VSSPTTETSTTTGTDLRERSETETDEPEVAHIGRRDDVTRAYITGEPIKALCGIVFVPTRDPSQYPPCQACEAVLQQIRAGRGGAN